MRSSPPSRARLAAFLRRRAHGWSMRAGTWFRASWTVPASFYPPIEQQALVLKKGAAVDALVAWLKGPGQAQIKAAGYALPQ